MHLDGTLPGSKPRPREHGQTEINGRGVQGIYRVVEIETKRLAGIHGASDVDERLGEVGIDAPVVSFICIGQSRARHLAAKAHVIQLASHRTQARFDVAQALTIGQLRKCQTKKLIPTGKAARITITAISNNAFLELLRRNVVHHLGEDRSAFVHAPLSRCCLASPIFRRSGRSRLKNFVIENAHIPSTQLIWLSLFEGLKK